MVPRLPPFATDVAGSSVIITLWPRPASRSSRGVLAMAVMPPFVESVAVSVHVVPVVIVTAAKVTEPCTMAADVVPVMVQLDVMVIVSAKRTVVSSLPYWSVSTTLNEVSAVPAVAVEGGSTENFSLFPAPGVTAVLGVLAAVVIEFVPSVAVMEQLVPSVICTFENVATPATAGTLVVPVSVHDEVRSTSSVEPVPDVMTLPVLSSTLTTNEVSVLPAVVVAGGSVV